METTEILVINRNLFKRMKELADRQEKVISEDLIDEFNTLSDKREDLKKRITANTIQYQKEKKERSAGKANHETRDISREITEIIRSIQDIDKRIEGIITEKKDLLLSDIKNIRKGKNAVNRYESRGKKMPRFMDRNG